ncbi:MAG: Grx4 family monothiol glutaredoxin [Proteobacteria bacterium]|nr:Grx4 family monothiol glutaredoxin [Pseudomonadota bacterium]
MTLSNKQDFDYIKKMIASHPVILFMKGTKTEPMCGFSNQVVQIMAKYGVDFHTVNILENQALRADLKVFSEWPTFPQLFVNQTFIGGCDIVCDLDKQGKLQELFSSRSTDS